MEKNWKKKHKENYTIFQEKLRKLENDCLAIKEKLKIYGYKDSSENADWTALNEKLLVYQVQIEWLKTKIKTVNYQNDKIITYCLLDTGEEKTAQLTNWEADHSQNKISPRSPLGSVLATKKVGEIGEVQTKQKSYKIKILNIEEK